MVGVGGAGAGGESESGERKRETQAQESKALNQAWELYIKKELFMRLQAQGIDCKYVRNLLNFFQDLYCQRNHKPGLKKSLYYVNLKPHLRPSNFHRQEVAKEVLQSWNRTNSLIPISGLTMEYGPRTTSKKLELEAREHRMGEVIPHSLSHTTGWETNKGIYPTAGAERPSSACQVDSQYCCGPVTGECLSHFPCPLWIGVFGQPACSWSTLVYCVSVYACVYIWGGCWGRDRWITCLSSLQATPFQASPRREMALPWAYPWA